MWTAGSNLIICLELQAFLNVSLHADPHPALRATLSPGEGFGRNLYLQIKTHSLSSSASSCVKFSIS